MKLRMSLESQYKMRKMELESKYGEVGGVGSSSSTALTAATTPPQGGWLLDHSMVNKMFNAMIGGRIGASVSDE